MSASGVGLMTGASSQSAAAVLAERRAESAATQRDDIAALLLAAVDEDGHPLSDGEIRDELMTLVLAGHETTANLLGGGIARLLTGPVGRRPIDRIDADDPAVLDEMLRQDPASRVAVETLLTTGLVVVAQAWHALAAGQCDLALAGGATYLHHLTSTVPTAANAGYYAQIVAEKAVLRRLVDAGTRIVQYGYSGSEGADVAEVREDLRRLAEDLSTLRGRVGLD